MSQLVNWDEIKKSLNRVTCIRKEHPVCEYHYTESQAFASLSRRIRETKQSIEILLEYKRLTKPVSGQCDLHWIENCAICSVIGRIEASITKARKKLGRLRFQMISLPNVAKALGRDVVTSSRLERSAVVEFERKLPIERIYGGVRAGNEPTRLRKSDLDDRIRLLDAWIRGKEEERKRAA